MLHRAFQILTACFVFSCVDDAEPPPDTSATDDVTVPAEAPTEMTDDSMVGFLHPGERLVFKLGWGIITGAGRTVIETFPRENPSDDVRVRVLTESRGIVSTFYPLTNDSSSFIDPHTGRSQRIEITGREGGKETRSNTIFDYDEGIIKHTDEIRTDRSGTAKLADEPVYDIMVTVLKLRQSPMKVGEKRHVSVAFDDDIYEIELTALKEERIRVPAGRFDTIEIEPKQLGELKGFFRKGGEMHFWLSKGDDPQIVRMDFRVKIGTISSVLTKIETMKSDESDEDPRP